MGTEILKVPEAARMLGVPNAYLRQHIRLGIWNFGECIPKEVSGKQRDEFIIYRRKLEKFLGRERT